MVEARRGCPPRPLWELVEADTVELLLLQLPPPPLSARAMSSRAALAPSSSCSTSDPRRLAMSAAPSESESGDAWLPAVAAWWGEVEGFLHAPSGVSSASSSSSSLA